MLTGLRHGALALAGTTGLDRIVGRSTWRRRRLLVLCYHGVALRDEDRWRPALYFPEPVFRRRMELLKQSGATVLPLGEGLDRLAAGTLPERAVALTFDDGMHDFHAAALPILRELRLPATVYLTTYYMLHQRPVFGVTASYLLWQARERRLEPWPAIGLLDERALRSEGQRQAVVDALLWYAAAADMSGGAKDELLQELAARVRIDDAGLRRERLLHVMSQQEATEAASAGIDFQLHTHRHRAPLDRAAFIDEIRDNARYVREVSGHEPRHFCYPSGQYDAAHLPWLREEGVRSATTCDVALANVQDDPLLLPRFVDTPLQPESTFLSWLSGAAGLIGRRRHPRGQRPPMAGRA